MAGLGPAIHAFVDCTKVKTWMTGLLKPAPAMTTGGCRLRVEALIP
jgi:hypothetical protein